MRDRSDDFDAACSLNGVALRPTLIFFNLSLAYNDDNGRWSAISWSHSSSSFLSLCNVDMIASWIPSLFIHKRGVWMTDAFKWLSRRPMNGREEEGGGGENAYNEQKKKRKSVNRLIAPRREEGRMTLVKRKERGRQQQHRHFKWLYRKERRRD